jgi:hypothetical protein|tara:strand:- start:3102 stop:3296 length:195 start_codon:yes stop_codon:yes gene_type:complete
MSIRLIGNDIEIDGRKVARVLDINASLRMRLEDYIRQADEYQKLSEETSSLRMILGSCVELDQS